MTNTIPFIQNQEYEGMRAVYTIKSSGQPLPLQTITECVFRIFKQDHSGLEFSGSYTGGEVTFLSDGSDGIMIFTIQTGDMSNYGIFKGEVETTLGGKSLKKQEFLVDIKKESPTSS